MTPQPNGECAQLVAQVLWTMSEANALDGLCKVVTVVAQRYRPETAAEFADLVVAELRAMPNRVL